MHTDPLFGSSGCRSVASQVSRQRLLLWSLALGLFILVSGKVWLVSGSGRNTQVYLWIILPVTLLGGSALLRRSIPRCPALYWPWLLFLGWVAMSTLWASGVENSAFSLAKRGYFILCFLVAVNVLLNQDEKLFSVSLYAGLLLVALGALASMTYQYAVLDKPLGYRDFRIYNLGYRDWIDYGWPVVAGIFHGAAATWVLGIALQRENSLKKTFFWLAAFAVLSLYVLMTGTRGAWAALAVSGMLIIAMQRSRLGLYGLLLLLLVFLLVLLTNWDRVLFELQQRQLSGREEIWNYFFSSMDGYWLTGHGLGTPFQYVWPKAIAVSPHAHSLYLQQVYDSGLVALLFMFAGLIGISFKAWKLRDNAWVRCAFPALVFALIAMLTDVERIFTRPGDYWTVFWLPLAVLLAVRSHLPVSPRSN